MPYPPLQRSVYADILSPTTEDGVRSPMPISLSRSEDFAVYSGGEDSVAAESCRDGMGQFRWPNRSGEAPVNIIIADAPLLDPSRHRESRSASSTATSSPSARPVIPNIEPNVTISHRPQH